MRTFRWSFLSFGLMGWLGCSGLAAEAAGKAIDRDEFALRRTSIAIRQVDLSAAVRVDERGYPRLDASKLDLANPRIVEREHRAVVLENRYVRVTVLPEMGRVYSLVSRVTGHEQLWINPIAKPLPGQLNDTGWWMVWGSVEYTIPRGEHGTTWALPWRWQVTADSARRKAVCMTVVEPQTRLRQSLEIALTPQSAGFEATIRITNTGKQEVRFSHWMNAMLAPGGRGELTPNTELVVPCRAMVVAERDFNRWMLGARLQDFERNPLRWVKHWRSIGDLLATNLTHGFYGAFSHEVGEGVVRVFDPRITPGMDIWTWGYPPPPALQREYCLQPNLGYVELWGGTAPDFSDAALRPLAPGRTLAWKEWMFPLHGTGGLTFANRQAAVCCELNPQSREINLGVFAILPLRRATVEVRLAGQVLLSERADLSPEAPWRRTLRLPAGADASQARPVLTIRQGRRTVLTSQARLHLPVLWGGQYLPTATDNGEN
ncbi:MAG: DUF5107 domain-containing protein [Verrucomicrobia bacterium]|nr:DUF5107 domain-containing protein [Verrucomicrobiota bacterium]